MKIINSIDDFSINYLNRFNISKVNITNKYIVENSFVDKLLNASLNNL